MTATAHETEHLRALFHQRLESVLRDGKASLLPPWLQDLGPAELKASPLLLVGFGDLGTDYLEKLQAAGFQVVGLIDDRRCSEVGLHAISELVDLHRPHPRALVLNAVAHSYSDHLAVTQICRAHRIPCLTAYQLDAALRWRGDTSFEAVIDPEYFADSVLAAPDELEEVAALFDDEVSRTVFWRIALARLTLCNSHFAAAKAVSPRQYFPDHFDYSGRQILVDAGPFDGADTDLFLSQLSPDATCHLFEIDPHNIALCSTRARELAVRFPLSTVKVWPMGVWSRTGQIRVLGQGKTARPADDSAPGDGRDTSSAAVAALDDKLEAITLLKLEVEGSELPALQGAQRLIRTCRPNLSVSVYHLADDMLSIPRYLKELDLGYELRLGHHTPWWSFTVLYARAVA